MAMRARLAGASLVGVLTTVATAGPAPAATGIPATPHFENAGGGTWVQKVDPAQFGGATGTVTFHDEGYRGPGGVSVNDFRIGDGFDAAHPAFVQDVQVVQRDTKTTDPASSPLSDGFGAQPVYRDANVDGVVNLGPFGWTTPPGTRFLNMAIDHSGNYFVKQQDMHWGFFDRFDFQPAGGGRATSVNTQMNFQPYPLSDAFGWCGSVLASMPEAVERQAGQLVFDVAFDVYPLDAKPGGAIRPMTQVVPGFVMRSYGRYEVDVTWSLGRQRFAGSTVGNNVDPVTRQLDPAWRNKVSPIGAGVIPSGAWVLDDNTPQMRVVAKDTPGATWHRNVFAGAAFILRGDVLRTVHYRSGTDYLNARRWTRWPLTARAQTKPAITITRLQRRGARVIVAGELPGSGRVLVSYAGRHGGRATTRARVRFGRFSASLPLPSRRAARHTLTIRYPGDRNNLAAVLHRPLRLR